MGYAYFQYLKKLPLSNFFDPESENLRKKSKLSVPDRNVEPAVASIGVVPDVSIRHELELKVHLALQEKGIKITDYNEDIPRPKPKEKKS